MEPWYPDPIYNSEYEAMDTGTAGVPLYVSKTTGAPYQFTGAVRTGLSFDTYASSPMKGGHFWVGYPAEYTAKM
jgi:hypothetical protein